MSFDGSFCIRPVPASTPDAIRAGDGYVLSDPPICRPSLDFNGKLCASEDVPSCPGQQRLMDGECVSPAKPRCVSGHTEDGETCVFSHCTDIEFCPGAQILCPRFHEKEFEISGQKVTIHCETCWQSDLDTIKVLGTHDMTDCMEAYLNHPECIGSNWFPDSKTCNCHSQSTTRTIKDGRCIALNAQRGQ
ncbi:hypothetical protein BDV25DRAFT_163960 [Aspergillus avenaceus]|uniref:Uncharacterized protein n=1 Tax=Aspergillus avenaceus TaxID=36643 RepID=A0A5N6THA6_ASPAV|nr:hypothetical protein BDV25DRAFT_163960 [Aspergillus avenaceus]